MPVSLNNLSSHELSFNSKYSLSFSYQRFRSKAGTSKKDKLNAVYVSTAKELIIQFVENKAANADVRLQSADLFIDFELLMTQYRNECAKENEAVPDVFAGLNNIQRLEITSEAINAACKTDAALTKKKYLSGGIRIRDMRADAMLVSQSLEPSDGDLLRLAKYSVALKQANDSRSGLWRFFHPFRNNAEKRDSAVIERILRDLCESHNKNADELMNQVQTIPQTLADEINSLNVFMGFSKKLSEAEPEELNESLEKNLEQDALRERLERMASIGYIPNPDNKQYELNILNQMLNNLDVITDPTVKKNAAFIIYNNKTRAESAGYMKTNPEYETQWKNEDATYSRMFHTYKAPTELLDIIKEPVTVDVETKTTLISSQVMSHPKKQPPVNLKE